MWPYCRWHLVFICWSRLLAHSPINLQGQYIWIYNDDCWSIKQINLLLLFEIRRNQKFNSSKLKNRIIHSSHTYTHTRNYYYQSIQSEGVIFIFSQLNFFPFLTHCVCVYVDSLIYSNFWNREISRCITVLWIDR